MSISFKIEHNKGADVAKTIADRIKRDATAQKLGIKAKWVKTNGGYSASLFGKGISNGNIVVTDNLAKVDIDLSLIGLPFSDRVKATVGKLLREVLHS